MIGLLAKAAGKAFRRRLRLLVAGLAVEGVLVAAGYFTLAPVLQSALQGDMAAASRALLFAGLVLALYIGVRWRIQIYGYETGVALARTLFDRLGRTIATLPLGWFTAARKAELSLLSSQGIVDIMTVPAHLLRPLVVSYCVPVLIIAYLIIIAPYLALALAICLPVGALALYRSSGQVRRSEATVHDAKVRSTERLLEFAQTQAVLRAYNQDGAAVAALHRELDTEYRAGLADIGSVGRGIFSFSLVVQLAVTLLLVVGVQRGIAGTLALPELIALLVLGLRFAEPLISIVDIQAALRKSEASLRRIGDILATPAMQTRDPVSVPQDAGIVFEAVHFSIGGRAILKGMDLRIPDRGLVAIVGPSGAGKSTMLRLIARFHDVDTGAVRLGGADVRHVETEVLMDTLAVVFQDVYLFSGTIGQNVLVGKPDAGAGELDYALQAAGLDTTLKRLANGIDTQVGEGGVALSGGEKQRVSIARALLKGADVILLDEAAAALDAFEEARLRDAIRTLARDRTVVAVSHRLNLIRSADKIVFVEEGRVVEEGTHAALLAAGGRYARFCRQLGM